jgi:serine/threonine-protein phosphatase 4 regulatory subunit 2
MLTLLVFFAVLEGISGPPFTIQRLCEVLLWPHETYTSIDKLALAIEKVRTP